MNSTQHRDRPPSKRERVIRVLLERRKANRFELERLANDHCPPSTISELKRDGLALEAALVEVPGFGGGVARIAEYRLPDHAVARAQELLQQATRRRAAGEP